MDGENKLVRITVYLEEEMIEAIDEIKKELIKETKKRWSRGAVIRLVISEFFSKRERIL